MLQFEYEGINFYECLCYHLNINKILKIIIKIFLSNKRFILRIVPIIFLEIIPTINAINLAIKFFRNSSKLVTDPEL